MICKGCGNSIPNKLLIMDRFECPYCGKLYRKKTAQGFNSQSKNDPRPKTKPIRKASSVSTNSMASNHTVLSLLRKYWYIVAVLFVILVSVDIINKNVSKKYESSANNAEQTMIQAAKNMDLGEILYDGEEEYATEGIATDINSALLQIQTSFSLLPELQVKEPAWVVIDPNGQRKEVSINSAKDYIRNIIKIDIDMSQNMNPNTIPVSFSIDYSEDDGWSLEIDQPQSDNYLKQMLEVSDETIYALFHDRIVCGMQSDFNAFLGTSANVGINILDLQGNAVLRIYSPANGGNALGDSPDMPGVHRMNNFDVLEDDSFDSDARTDGMQRDAASNAENSQMSSELNTYEQALQHYGVTLNNVDVQYDMPHLFTEYFSLVGVAELDDYYNFGYYGLESKYFNLRITPENGDSWSIYCDRNAFAGLFEFAKKNPKFKIKSICRMDIYQGEQANLATMYFAS